MQIYSPIEIDVVPIKHKYGKFIHWIIEDGEHFHIYFNDNKEEIKRNILNKDYKVSKIKINITNMMHMFDGCFF